MTDDNIWYSDICSLFNSDRVFEILPIGLPKNRAVNSVIRLFFYAFIIILIFANASVIYRFVVLFLIIALLSVIFTTTGSKVIDNMNENFRATPSDNSYYYNKITRDDYVGPRNVCPTDFCEATMKASNRNVEYQKPAIYCHPEGTDEFNKRLDKYLFPEVDASDKIKLQRNMNDRYVDNSLMDVIRSQRMRVGMSDCITSNSAVTLNPISPYQTNKALDANEAIRKSQVMRETIDETHERMAYNRARNQAIMQENNPRNNHVPKRVAEEAIRMGEWGYFNKFSNNYMSRFN